MNSAACLCRCSVCLEIHTNNVQETMLLSMDRGKCVGLSHGVSVTHLVTSYTLLILGKESLAMTDLDGDKGRRCKLGKPGSCNLVLMWVVVKIMVLFWVPIIVRHLIFRVPKKGP